MPGITLRMARPGDADAMLEIYAPYVEQTTASWEYETPSLAEFTGRLREHLDAGFPWLVAEEGGAVLGYAYAGRFAARRGYDWDAEATVYLSAAAHRRYVGTALYTALLALLRKQGYINCFALITHPNPASAAFHARLGFAEVARLPHAGYKHGQWLGLSYYQRTLQPPPAAPMPPVPLSALDAGETQAVLGEAAAQAACGAPCPEDSHA